MARTLELLIVTALEREWRSDVRWHRASPIVMHDNYDALGYPVA